MSWRSTQILPLFLAAMLWLTPRPAQAFAFDTALGPFVLQHQTVGNPVVWDPPRVTMSLNLGSLSRGVTLVNSTTSWDTNVADALAIWNTIVPNFFTFDTAVHNPCDHGDMFNTVGFAHDDCGDGFGDVIAFTRKTYEQRAEGVFVTHADVMLNAHLCWNAYAGPLQLCDRTLDYAIDLHRVVLHELGHVLGLEHPDEAGQTVTALMNRSISDIDTLTQDDRTGAAFLYPPLPIATASLPNRREGGGGGGCTLRPGRDVDPTLGAVLLFLGVVLVWKHTRRVL